jgi:cholesterol transport system auxiliary component
MRKPSVNSGNPAIRLLAFGLLLPVFLLSSCGKAPPLIHQYVFEYNLPAVSASPKLNEALKIKRFKVAQAYNTTDMVYQPGPLRRETYKRNRWRVNPGYLVTDYLTRDLRHADLFQAVFGHDDTGKSRFLLEGGVEEIQEIDASAIWQASLALTVTLLDLNENEITKRVVFQRTYRATEPMLAQTPQGLADAMSRGMQRLSQEIVTDVYQAARMRTEADKRI